MRRCVNIFFDIDNYYMYFKKVGEKEMYGKNEKEIEYFNYGKEPR